VDNESEVSSGEWCEKRGSAILFGDNVEISVKDRMHPAKSLPKATTDPLKFAVQQIIDFAERQGFLNVVRVLMFASSLTLAIEIQSLSAIFENVPISLAQQFATHLEKDLSLAKDVAHCILHVAGAPIELVSAVLRVKATSHCKSYTVIKQVRNPIPTHLVVSVFAAVNLGTAQGRTTCVAVSKCIRLMRDRVWKLHGRVMVLCVSAHDDIVFSKVIPGSSPKVVQLRNKLTARLLSLPQIERMFIDDDTLSGERNMSDTYFFVISFARAVHNHAVDELFVCCRNLKIVLSGRISNVVVNV